MESFDQILTKLAPDLPSKPDLVVSVLAKIKARRERRARLLQHGLAGSIGLALALLILTVTLGNSGKVLWLGLSKSRTVSSHLGLYLRALIEAVGLPAVVIFGLLAIAITLITKFKTQLTRRAGTAAAAIGMMAILSVSASATATASIARPAGILQQELERTVNGIGKTNVTVDGQTYELASGSLISDRQLKAHAEYQALIEFRKTLDLPVDGSDGGTLAYAGFLASVSPTEIVLSDEYPDSLNFKINKQSFTPTRPKTLKLSAKTTYLQGAKKVDKLDLKPGDYIEVATAKDFVTAGYVSKFTYDPSDYDWTPEISTQLSKHRTDGKCYNNEVDRCPNLPAVSGDIAGQEYQLPADAVVREVFGQLISNDGEIFKVKTSSGAIWSFNEGSSITALNLSGYYCPTCPGGADRSFQISNGDYLRVEFWQHQKDLSKREVFDQGFRGTKQEAQQLAAEGKLDYHPEIYIRTVQIALEQPWYQGQVPVKYRPQ